MEEKALEDALTRFNRAYEDRMRFLLASKETRLAEIDSLGFDERLGFAVERSGLVTRIQEIRSSLA